MSLNLPQYSGPNGITPPFPTTAAMLLYFNPYTAEPGAYYSLHKVHFDKQSNPTNIREFHAGGYYNHSDNNRTTFIVTPERLASNLKCKQEWCAITSNFKPPLINPLPLHGYTVMVMALQTTSTKYMFYEVDCGDFEPIPHPNGCGNEIIRENCLETIKK